MKKVGLVSLGCDKNRVDGEKMLFALSEAGYKITEIADEADVLIVNTCAFIKAAKEEAIENILAAAELKKTTLQKLVVTGCFSTRYAGEAAGDLPEVDAFVSVADEKNIVAIIDGLFGEKSANGGCFCGNGRILTTPPHYAYLKIADGCDNRCSYCAIPAIRGRYVSEPVEKLVAEAENLYRSGVKELILVAQDTTNYGRDLYGAPSLVKLLTEIVKIDFWKIRILYAYPELIDGELLDFIVSHDRMAKYLDIPIQHIDDGLLKKMRRRSTENEIKDLLARIRGQKRYIAVRSSFITGFPSETEQAQKKLVEFLHDSLDYAGFFVFSPEEGTPAYGFKEKVPLKTARKRKTECEKAQQESTVNRQNRLVGQTVEVIYEGIDGRKNIFFGRTEYCAPDIDTKVFFSSRFPLEIGNVYNVKITAGGFDLLGETVGGGI
jgi:ribosomal protein S12 methylthiotransferase